MRQQTSLTMRFPFRVHEGFQTYGTVASDRCMHSASSCCISRGELGLNLITPDAAVVYFPVRVKGPLIGWLEDVYPLLGSLSTRAYSCPSWIMTQQNRAARCLVSTFTSLATSKSNGIILPSPLAQSRTPARLQKHEDYRSLPV